MSPAPSRRDPAGSAYLDLRQLARSRGRPTDELFQLYALEAFLDRLAGSNYHHDLILKGGVLLAAFDVRRPTRDIDFAAQATIDSDPEHIRVLINDVLSVPRRDGLVFDIAQTGVESIRDHEPYPSTRARISGTLATAKIRFHVDINTGDPLWPKPEPITIPRLLGGPAIPAIGYSRELVLAEKIVTAIQRGTANTRWRDFADIATLATHTIDTDALGAAISRVAAHRRTNLAPLSEVLEGFAAIAQPRWVTWRAKQHQSTMPATFADLLQRVVSFADPHIITAQQPGPGDHR